MKYAHSKTGSLARNFINDGFVILRNLTALVEVHTQLFGSSNLMGTIFDLCVLALMIVVSRFRVCDIDLLTNTIPGAIWVQGFESLTEF